MSNKQQPSTTKFYVSLSIKELQALGKVSGEAMRVYVAIASFCFGATSTTYAKHPAIAEKMGKTKGATRRSLNKYIGKLKDAGLIETYWANVGEYSYLHYKLPLKAEVIKKRTQKQGKQEGAGQKKPINGARNGSKAGQKMAHNNNRINNNNKHLSNNEIINKEIEEWAGEETEEIFPQKKVKLSNGNQCSLKKLVNDFLEEPGFITFYLKQDQETILNFLEENNYGIVVRSLKKEISRE